MARGGVNKATVQTARLAVIARGEHPSIDAVRVQLGNTGSKTTIHRYLKELDSTSPAEAPEAVIDDELNALVSRLAERLRVQAQERLEAGEARLEGERQEWRQTLAHRQLLSDELQRRVEDLQQRMAHQASALDVARTERDEARTEAARLAQVSIDLNERVADRDARIASLEDKHQHARHALEHYRSAVKEQREQDRQRHEQQLQQAHVELRQARQQSAIQLEQLTSLNRDNERLLTEQRAAREDARQQREGRARSDTLMAELNERHQQAITLGAVLEQRLQARSQEAATAIDKLTERDQQYRVLELILARTEAALDNQRQRNAPPQADPAD